MNTAAIRQRIERLVGQPVVHMRMVERGYSIALRMVVTLADGTTMFAKVATTPDLAAWLRREQHAYTSLSGSFMPAALGWDDDDAMPLLLLEDLSAARWPPPWLPGDVERVLEALHMVAQQRLPGLARVEESADMLNGWAVVAADPQPFLALGLADERWLHAALPTLLGIDGAAAVHGDALLHCDVRSDNLCFHSGRAMLVDWNHVRLGNPRFDIAFWLPSLENEGGPAPATIMPDAGALAAIVSGFFAARAGLPPPAGAPRVRAVQLQQLRSALPWAVHALGLPRLSHRQ
jgi:hypothetical protein